MRLYIVVEGYTEDDFVKSVLADHLVQYGFTQVVPIIVETSRREDGYKHKGGGRWKNWRRDLDKLTSQQKRGDVRFTTMFDLYGLPRDFPGLKEYGNDTDTRRRVENLEAAMEKEVGDWRFIPYIQRHEFEALVLVGLDELDLLLDADDDLAGLERLRQDIAGQAPEDINDGENTAPSKRLQHCIPGYQKRLHGPEATATAGLDALRHSCPRFDQWVGQLERQLGQGSSS